ncbi:hypothetical protein [Klebsiella spallanzanii]|uniref:hypothetical protein n=1 Tax=Klebsiella spallanzanii TaxID=2587528 RepID=UPI00115A1B42|nr:hypothetical protein [Klebsiella spallanzanii]VUT02242.1 hypothetical protein SB6419_01707 [Klebsiella spallanzanii]
MKKMIEISYYPAISNTNQYCFFFRKALNAIGIVDDFSYRKSIKKLIKFQPYNYTIINWIENDIISRTGHFYFIGFIKFLMKFLFIRLTSIKVVFVKHNEYPHPTKGSVSICLAKCSIKLLEILSNIVIVHSPIYPEDHKHYYVPHPLYGVCTLNNPDGMDDNLYVNFGRIIRYKKTEELIAAFPDNKKLLIIGVCDDEDYLAELQRIIRNKNNIEIRAGYISNEDAKMIISKSSGVIITHAEKNMIVSGSFFHSLTFSKRILAIETPFLNWASAVFSPRVLVCFSSIKLMMDSVSLEKGALDFQQTDINEISQQFGNEKIITLLKNIII